MNETQGEERKGRKERKVVLLVSCGGRRGVSLTTLRRKHAIPAPPTLPLSWTEGKLLPRGTPYDQPSPTHPPTPFCAHLRRLIFTDASLLWSRSFCSRCSNSLMYIVFLSFLFSFFVFLIISTLKSCSRCCILDSLCFAILYVFVFVVLGYSFCILHYSAGNLSLED